MTARQGVQAYTTPRDEATICNAPPSEQPVTWVGVGMEETMLQQLPQGALDADVHKLYHRQPTPSHGSLGGSGIGQGV